MNCTELEALILQIGNNDLNALEKLYDNTRVDVFKFALSILKNKDDAEDVMQDTYVNINKYASNYKSNGKPLSYILTITKNLSLNKIKARKNNVDIIDYENILSVDNNKGFNLLLIKGMFEILTEEERKIIMLATIENYKFKEIANMLDLNLSTTLSKYHRGVKKIKKLYKEGE